MLDRPIGTHYSETSAVGGTIHDRIISAIFPNLFLAEGNDLFACPFQLVFPSKDFCSGEQIAQMADEFRRRDQLCEKISVARAELTGDHRFELAVCVFSKDSTDGKVRHGGGVEDSIISFARSRAEALQKIFGGGESNGRNGTGLRADGVVTFEKRHFMSGRSKMVCQTDSQLTSGEVREAANLIHIFVSGSTRDQAAHIKNASLRRA